MEIFTSMVEYVAGDEISVRGGRWEVERVEQEGIEHEDGDSVTVRNLFCVIRGQLNRRTPMAVAFIQEFKIEGDDRTTSNYDAVNEKLVHDEAPVGLIIHYAGFDEDAAVFRIVTLWETREQGEAYDRDRVMPAVREVIGEDIGSRGPAREAAYELHNVAKP